MPGDRPDRGIDGHPPEGADLALGVDGRTRMERLSGMDAFFLYVESPTQHMHVTLCAVLDPSEIPGGYTFERFRDHIGSRVHLIPAFGRRLVPIPLRVHHPL